VHLTAREPRERRRFEPIDLHRHDKRARVVAACNVLNAAFIVAGTIVVAILQKFGATLPQLFVLLGIANIVALIVVARTMPANGLRDFLTTMLRAMYRMEVKGAENLDPDKAGPNPIVALNHVSFLDAAVALSCWTRSRCSRSTTTSRSAGG